MKKFNKILIANRGEIARRIIQTAHKMGIKTIAVFTSADQQSLHISEADQAVKLEGISLSETYMNKQLLIQIAQQYGADAIHPGYGFLAENADFASSVEQAGLIFIGPTPEQIRRMGEKNEAIELARSLKIPVPESLRGNQHELKKNAHLVGFPLMVKAVAGGGGKGMILAHSPDELHYALEKAERQATDYFGNGDLYLEKYIEQARHVEVQLLGDQYGKRIHLFERECSIQRRYQKILEEAPASSLTDNLRKKLYTAALKIGQSMNYQGLGTVEFLIDNHGNYYFLEMNTRIQVEHPVTEAVTGIDLVEQQLLAAAGNRLTLEQESVTLNGHAMEARICAEELTNDFRPSTGVIEQVYFPELNRLRTDSFIQSGTNISPWYDSLLAKQIAHAPNRQAAIQLLQQGLQETIITGLHTNISFLLQLLNDINFQQNQVYTSYLSQFEMKETEKPMLIAAAYLFAHFFRNNGKRAVNLWTHLGMRPTLMPVNIRINQTRYNYHLEQIGQSIRLYQQEQFVELAFSEITDQLLKFDSEGSTNYVFISEKESETHLFLHGRNYQVQSNLIVSQIRSEKKEVTGTTTFQSSIHSEMFGKIISISARPNEMVEKGAVLLTIESMKTEFRILCPQKSIVKSICTEAGQMIKDGQLLLELSAPIQSEDTGSTRPEMHKTESQEIKTSDTKQKEFIQ